MQQNKDGVQKWFNQYGHSKILILLSLIFSVILNAGTFSEFKKSYSAPISNINEKDKDFSTVLSSRWEAYVSTNAKPLYMEAKPDSITAARDRNLQKAGPKVSVFNTVTPLYKYLYATTEAEAKDKEIVFDFFGSTIGFNIPDFIDKSRFYPQSQLGVNNFFNNIASSNYEELLDNIKIISSDLRLNDWGDYLLVKNISEKIFQSSDEATILSWFLLRKLGYAVKISLVKKHVVLLLQSNNTIHSTPYFMIDKKKYYALSGFLNSNSEKVFTYSESNSTTDKAFDFSMNELPLFKEDIKSKTLSFKHDGESYSIKHFYNQNLIDFMFTYPQVDSKVFFETPLEDRTYDNIANQLKKYISSKQASVAISFILNFVQNSFKYEADNKQFSREKAMFAEETLYYDKSDSEDRAALFAYLIKKLLKIGVVGIKYKDHMSTGLYIPINGDSVNVFSKKYIICDATYKNATIGQSIPKYKNIQPVSFVILKNKR